LKPGAGRVIDRHCRYEVGLPPSRFLALK